MGAYPKCPKCPFSLRMRTAFSLAVADMFVSAFITVNLSRMSPKIPKFDGADGANVAIWLADFERAVEARGLSGKLPAIAQCALLPNVMAIIRDIQSRLSVPRNKYVWSWESLKVALLLIHSEWFDRSRHLGYIEQESFFVVQLELGQSQIPLYRSLRAGRNEVGLFLFIMPLT